MLQYFNILNKRVFDAEFISYERTASLTQRKCIIHIPGIFKWNFGNIFDKKFVDYSLTIFT